MAFREDFVWGAASSAYQTEGFPSADGGGESIWDAFCRRPGAIANGDNGSIACDGYHRFEEDIRLLSSLGLRAYRFPRAGRASTRTETAGGTRPGSNTMTAW